MEHSTNKETGANWKENGVYSAGQDRALQPLTEESGGPKGAAPIQPLRCFWPPPLGSDIHKRLESEHPDVLAWRFDTARPFDRPWKTWTGKRPLTLGASSGCASFRGLAEETLPDGEKPAMRQQKALDEQFRGLNLPRVQPESFHHLAPLELYRKEKPYKCQLPKECFSDFKMHNVVSKSYPVSIAEINGHEDLFSLAVSGFEFAKCPITLQDWSDENVTSDYTPRLVEWLKQRLGGRDAFCYAYNFRHHGTAHTSDNPRCEFKPPFLRAHCDATETTCKARLQLYYPDSYQAIMQERVRFINVWRPISPVPVTDCPLAMCDFRTVDQEDLVPIDIVYPHFVDEAYEVKYNPSHRWFYKKGMTQEDAIIFKLYDSLRSEATVCPHSAFVDPAAPLDAPRRASIEIKAIVLG